MSTGGLGDNGVGSGTGPPGPPQPVATRTWDTKAQHGEVGRGQQGGHGHIHSPAAVGGPPGSPPGRLGPPGTHLLVVPRTLPRPPHPVPKVGMILAHQDPKAPPEGERWLPPPQPRCPFLTFPFFHPFWCLWDGAVKPHSSIFLGGTPLKAPRMGREAPHSHLGGGFIHSSPQRSHEGFCSAPGGQLVAGRWGPLAPRPPPPVSPGVPRPAGRCRGGVRAVPAGSEP